MNVDRAVQLRLLDLQAADTALAQLAHRRRTVPEITALAEAATRADALTGEALDLQGRIDDIAGDQRRFENEIETVRARKARDEQRLAAGTLPAKDLEGLQHEVTSLARRQSTLEDDLLEVMEQRETLDTELSGIEQARAVLDAERAAAEASRDAAFTEIDAALARRHAERAAVAAEMPEELLALYEKIGAQIGSPGAAALRHRRCEGCRIELSGTELSAARSAAPDSVLRCENCRRILVRTADSGL